MERCVRAIESLTFDSCDDFSHGSMIFVIDILTIIMNLKTYIIKI